MSVIAKCGVQVAKEYTGKHVYAKVGNRKHQVYFRVVVDDLTLEEGIDLINKDRNVLMLKYEGTDAFISTFNFGDFSKYIAVERQVGNDLTEEDIRGTLDSLPSAVSVIFKLPDDYKDIRFLSDMSHKFDRISFCAKNMFCFEDCNFGCCGRKLLDKYEVKYDKEGYLKEDCPCACQVLDVSALELTATVKAEKVKTTSSAPKKAKKAKFSDLLYSQGKVSL